MKALRVVRWIAFGGLALLLIAIAVFEFAPDMRERVLPRSDGTGAASSRKTR